MLYPGDNGGAVYNNQCIIEDSLHAKILVKVSVAVRDQQQKTL